MTLGEWLTLNEGDEITRDGRKAFPVEAVATRIGAHMAVRDAGCLQTEYKEWFRFEKVTNKEEVIEE